MDRRSNPGALRRRIAETLRELRVGAGVTMDEAAAVLGCSKTKISRLENCQAPLNDDEIGDLLDRYGLRADDQRRRELLEDVRATLVLPWWHSYRNLIPAGARRYISLESEACLLRICATWTVPDLLQTGAYAAALGSSPGGRRETRRMRSFREERQRRVREAGTRLWIIVDESVLRRQVGSPDVMREQCEALISAAKEPFVTMQVVPLARQAGEEVTPKVAPGTGIPFTIVRFDDKSLGDITYAETPGGSICTDRNADNWRAAAEYLTQAAADADATPDIIGGIW